VQAPVQPHCDKPGEGNDREDKHEFLVGGGLLVARRQPQPLGEQRRIGFRQP
jgi:hypothetical protein